MTCVIKRTNNFLTDNIHLLLWTAHALDVGQEQTQAPYHSFQFWSLCIWNVNFGRRRHISMMFFCIFRGRHNMFYEWTNIFFAILCRKWNGNDIKAVDLIVLKWFHPFQCSFFLSNNLCFYWISVVKHSRISSQFFFRLVYCCVDALIAAICSLLKSSNVPPAVGE